MLHRENRQFEADDAPDLARPQSRCVDDVLGDELALVGDHRPMTRRVVASESVTRVKRYTSAPSLRAAFAYACVTPDGST